MLSREIRTASSFLKDEVFAEYPIEYDLDHACDDLRQETIRTEETLIQSDVVPVSYTHLTLPTNDRV